MLSNTVRFLSMAIIAMLVVPSSAFYLPGVAPVDYDEGQKVDLLVNALTPGWSVGSTPFKHSVFSMDYYQTNAFHFCQPEGGPKKQTESIGAILFGDRIYNSPYDLRMKKDDKCHVLCTASFNSADAYFVSRRIRDDTMQNWLIDGLPAAHQVKQTEEESVYIPGFPLGYVEGDAESPRYYYNNHYDINVEYHSTKSGKFRVVGVTVTPQSRDYKDATGKEGFDCGASYSPIEFPAEPKGKEDIKVTFTYSVQWTESSTSWATRWDKYLHVYDPKIHWFSLINSIIIVAFLAGMMSTILLRAIRKDIARYNELDLTEEVQEDSGWKLVHGDVFRPPKHRMLLSVLVGTGAQLFGMAGVTLLFALLGFLSPSNRGALSTVMLLVFVVFSFVAGYVSSRTYRTLGGEAWKLNMALTPMLVPGCVFGLFIILNFVLVFNQASGAVPFGTMVALIALWFVLSVPLSVVGSVLGLKKGAFALPVRTNQIPRQIPPQPTYLKPIPSTLLAGILPFCAIFVELYFIISSLWFHRIYYMFGFLFVCFTLMVITSSTVAILMVYFSLCAENYHWQWRSFVLSGASSIYIFLHSLIFLASKLSLGGFSSNMLYIGYSFLISLAFFVTTGTMGYIATFFFIRRIYSSIKID